MLVSIVHYISQMESTPKSTLLDDDKSPTNLHLQLRQLPPLHQQILQLQDQADSQGQQREIQVKYYLQFKKIYFTSFKLWSQILKQSKIKEGLGSRIVQMEMQLAALHKSRRHEDVEEEIEEQELSSRRKNNKRTRRTAEEIERKYYCGAEFCGRCYGSEGSLQQHIKLKHPELYRHSEGEEDY